MPCDSKLTILHFNDCYNIEPQPREPIGGAARFATALKSFSDLNPMILFSGDILAPSIMSTFTKGEQMIPVLNALNVTCAVFGNHDFDFGVNNLIDVVNQTSFPWLLSNVIDNDTHKPLANGKLFHVLEWSNKKIGLIGLVEQEWLVTLATIDPEEVTYLDFVDEGRKLARMLKDQGCDLVIALTHMRNPNDFRLAENVSEIDLILGGHDHVYEVNLINDKYVIKSGTDFRQLSKITVDFDNLKKDVHIEEVNITGKYEENEELKEKLEKYMDVVEGRLDDVLGYFSTELDGRFSNIRTSETNLGNFVCDIMLSCTHSDLAILNSGTFRSDQIHPSGDLKLRELLTILPMMDSLIVLEATGEQILNVLENGVSQYPKLEGRFPQVAGVRFVFNPENPPGERVPARLKYKLVTKSYLALGKDGYDTLKDCKVLVSEDESPELCTSVQNHFTAIKILSGATKCHSRHRQSLICLSRRSSFVKSMEAEHHSTGFSHHLNASPNPTNIQRGVSLDITAKRQMMLRRQPSLDDVEREQCKLAPHVDGRIQIFTPELELELEQERNLYNEMEQSEQIIEEEESDIV
ncbi:Trifunctional nucleotide phosphoesterase protein YfkN [Nymphon striatum]|nr:Trifunctional nucleotide phosphoesterase protein YfkN [Nymphon striatum]